MTGASVEFLAAAENPLRRGGGLVVGLRELESLTSSVSRKRSNQLSYAPAKQYLGVYQDQGGRERWMPLATDMLYHRSLTKNRCSQETALPQD